MEKADGGYWRFLSNSAKPGTEYVYQLDKKPDLPDPASQFQPHGVFGASMVVDHEAYMWRDAGWRGIDLKDAVFYEVHVGAFTPEGTFRAAAAHVGELSDLGINALELMPPAQFPGARNWGYDTAFPFAVQNSYGAPDDLKALVDECHRRGVAVFVDVVYNHGGPEGNFLNEFGPYFVKTRMTTWGPTVNLDGDQSTPVRAYFLQNSLHWFRNYHVDGLRLDAVLSMPDTSPRHFLQELHDAVHGYSEGLGRCLWLVAESGFNEPIVLTPVERGGFGFDAQWLDDFQHAIFALITGEKEGYYGDYGTIQDVLEVFTEAYAYLGIKPQVRRRQKTESFYWIPSHKLVVFSQNHDQVGNRLLSERLTALAGQEAAKLAAGLVVLSTYVPLLFMGEEYGEMAPFNFFVDYADGALAAATRTGRVEEFAEFHWRGEALDPAAEETFRAAKLNWQLRKDPKHQQVQAYYKALIALRRRLLDSCFADRHTMKLATSANQKILFLSRCQNQTNYTNLVIANFSKETQTFTFPLQGDYTKTLDSTDTTWAGEGALLPKTAQKGDRLHIRGFGFAFYENQTTPS